jgi:hypothetical protein
MAGVSIDDPGFISRFFDCPKMMSRLNAEPCPDHLGSLLIVLQAYLNKVKAAKRVRRTLSFERLASSCSEPTAGLFLEGTARAD